MALEAIDPRFGALFQQVAIGVWAKSNPRFVVYAGQPDAKNPSRFMVNGVLKQQPFQITATMVDAPAQPDGVDLTFEIK